MSSTHTKKKIKSMLRLQRLTYKFVSYYVGTQLFVKKKCVFLKHSMARKSESFLLRYYLRFFFIHFFFFLNINRGSFKQSHVGLWCIALFWNGLLTFAADANKRLASTRIKKAQQFTCAACNGVLRISAFRGFSAPPFSENLRESSPDEVS